MTDFKVSCHTFILYFQDNREHHLEYTEKIILDHLTILKKKIKILTWLVASKLFLQNLFLNFVKENKMLFPSILMRWSEFSAANISLTQGKVTLSYFDLNGEIN